jgi:dolichol-phosphate mannosyltransferase
MENLISGWTKLKQELNEFSFNFILVDDGSTDGTAAEAKKLATSIDLTVLSHETNRGPGYAFGTGFDYLAGKLQEKDIVVTMEGDNTSRIETLKIMLGRIVRENVDVTLASPLSYGGGVTNTKWHRRMLGHMSSALTKIVLDIRGINTFTSFFRAYQGRVILILQKKYGSRILEFTGFECMVELLKKLTIFEFSISEVPMKLDTSLRKGKSKLKIFRTALKYFLVFNAARKWNTRSK